MNADDLGSVLWALVGVTLVCVPLWMVFGWWTLSIVFGVWFIAAAVAR